MLKRKKITTEPEQHVLGRRVMERIRAEKIEPVPVSTFLVHKLLLGIAIALSGFIAVFFTSIVFYRIVAIQFFGRTFIFEHFPWFASGLALCGVLLTFALLEYYKVLYKFSLISLFIFVCVVSAAGGFLLNKTPLHTRLENSIVGGIYAVEETPLHVYAGRAIEVRTQNSFVLETLRGDHLHVYIPAGVRLPADGINEGQSIFVAGYQKGGQFVVKGVLTIGKPKA